jgi:tetratricopeptide (TPR) repeat protein
MSGRRDQHDADVFRRTEPTLGDLDHLDAPRTAAPDGLPRVTIEPRRPPAHAPARPVRRRERRRSWIWMLLVILVAGLGAWLWFNQGRVRSMVPRTDFDTVIGQANQALLDGRLDGQSGTSARELFQSALALEPDNDRAHDGLRQVGRAELSQADASLQTGQLAQAAQQASVARELLGGGSDIDRLDQAIAKAHGAQTKTVDVIDRAQQALAAGKLDGPDGAGALYRQVLQSDPGNAVAAHGLDQVGFALAVQARKAFDANDQVLADSSVTQLAALQPGNSALPALRALQTQRRQQSRSELDGLLGQAQEALRAGRIAGNGSDTALAHYKAVLAIDPDNVAARSGLGNVAQALTVQANAALDAGDTAQASILLGQAAALAPKSADLAAARARLKASPAAAPASVDAGSSGEPDQADLPQATPAISPQQSAAVAQLVQRARQATRQGSIMMPPGDSAYDLYRSALAIDGNNVDALHGLQSLPVQVEQQFRQALADGKLADAEDMLANLDQLSPGDAAQGTRTHQLASAWLDRAEQQLAQDDTASAAISVNHARKLAPGDMRVQDLQARLQQGSP